MIIKKIETGIDQTIEGGFEVAANRVCVEYKAWLIQGSYKIVNTNIQILKYGYALILIMIVLYEDRRMK
jgi:hypothetical protein